MDRFVMRDPVPEEVEALHAIRHVAPNSSSIICRRVVCESGGKCGYPQGGQVGGFAQVPPEPESQFGDDLAMLLTASAPLGSALASIADVRSGSRRKFAREELPSSIPDALPSLSGTITDKRIVHRIAKHDLETAEVLVKGGACSSVPVV